MEYLAQTTPERRADGLYRWIPDQAWYQGLGVYGGLTFAHIVNVVSSLSAHPVRRLSVELCAPIVDQETTLAIQSKRTGGKTEFFSLELTQGDACVALAHVTCGADRTGDLDRTPTKTLPPRSGAIVDEALLMPPFARFFTYEPTRGQIPMGGSAEAVLTSGGWIEPKFDCPRDPALVVALIDAWWPAILGAAKSPRPMGTMSFAMDFLSPPVQEPGPFYLEISTAHVSNGYSLEINELWDHQGNLLAHAQQNIAVIR